MAATDKLFRTLVEDMTAKASAAKEGALVEVERDQLLAVCEYAGQRLGATPADDNPAEKMFRKLVEEMTAGVNAAKPGGKIHVLAAQLLAIAEYAGESLAETAAS